MDKNRTAVLIHLLILLKVFGPTEASNSCTCKDQTSCDCQLQDITVVLPSGLNVTVESEWGETVVVNDTVTINITVDAAEVPLTALTTSRLLTTNRTSGKLESSSGEESGPSFSLTVLVGLLVLQ
ncbi:hypothetical protein Bbelb_091760 [Branchiostoma belcheri]|nr:hypothetical protein Bbelb_091760 [Branchiostoma belcheri]